MKQKHVPKKVKRAKQMSRAIPVFVFGSELKQYWTTGHRPSLSAIAVFGWLVVRLGDEQPFPHLN